MGLGINLLLSPPVGVTDETSPPGVANGPPFLLSAEAGWLRTALRGRRAELAMMASRPFGKSRSRRRTDTLDSPEPYGRARTSQTDATKVRTTPPARQSAFRLP